MADTIEKHLATIDGALAHHGRAVLLDLLRPGISAGLVRDSLSSVGLHFNHEVESLFGWHDGVADGGTIGEVSLFPGFFLLSLEHALADYRTFISDDRWQDGWFPFLADGGGDFYIVDLGASGETKVRRFRSDADETPVEFLSLGSMIQTIAEAFDEGVIYVDADGWLEWDPHGFATVAGRVNPGVQWWN